MREMNSNEIAQVNGGFAQLVVVGAVVMLADAVSSLLGDDVGTCPAGPDQSGEDEGSLFGSGSRNRTEE